LKTVDQIHAQVFKRRLSPHVDYAAKGWKFVEPRGRLWSKISELLAQGYTVAGGYFTTAVRGYHDYQLMYKKGNDEQKD